jgi:hypothetical protein
MRLSHVVSLTILCCAAADAQFGSLAVSNDASEVYFRTGLRLKNEPPDRYSNAQAIYHFAAGAMQRLTTPASPAGPPYEADSNPQLSGDGSVFSYTHYPSIATAEVVASLARRSAPRT